jgi:hypothetical protein
MSKVTYGQRGYVGSSMSQNAALAYASGEMPKSKWTKRRMLEEIRSYCEMFGVKIADDVPDMKKDELFERFFEWKGWHHVGKYANEVDFYGLDEDAVCGMNGIA